MKTTGPIVAIGLVTVANNVIINGQPFEWRVPVGTAAAAAMFALLEKGWEDGAVALSYLALVAVLFTRLDPKVPAPMESFNKWFTAGKKAYNGIS